MSYLSLSLPERINIIQTPQDQEVSMGDIANFTCSAEGSNTSIFWEIGGAEYRDCSTPLFCVRDTTGEGSVNSRIEITTGEDMIVEDTLVECIVEQRFGDQMNRDNSIARLTMIPTTSKCAHTLAKIE